MSVNASATSESPALFLRYLDVVLVVLAAPILLLIGVPAVGYGIGAGAWVALRVVGVGVERYASTTDDARAQISVRLAYMLGRIFLLALAVILAQRAGGKHDGLTALAVIVFAFTMALLLSIADRPRRRPAARPVTTPGATPDRRMRG